MKCLGMGKGDLFTIEEFCDLLDSGDIISYDGFGYYSFGTDKSGQLVDFQSNIVKGVAKRKGYTHVIWHNR